MELRHLKYFITVAEELHFTRAAEKLFIVQPALSRQIKQLEDELGVLLFNRTKRVVTLTEAGQFFYKEVKELFLMLDQAKSRTKQIETGSVGKIRVGYVGSSMMTVLPKLITTLQKKQPDLHLELFEIPAKIQMESLLAEKLDIGFLRIPYEEKDLNQEVIFIETYSLVLPANHKKSEKNYKGLHEFAGENFILPPRSAGEKYFDNIISLCTSAGFSPNIVHESHYENATVRLVENNIGISIFPTSYRKAFNAKVKFIELKDIPDRLQLSIVWKKNNNNASLLMIIKIIEKLFKFY
jgi:DNA-binding transcriptional LysR family regulator